MSKFDLRSEVNRRLSSSGEADPHVIADKMVDDLTADEKENALRVTLPHYVREAVRMARQTRSGHNNHSSRWKRAGHSTSFNHPFEWRVYTGARWVLLKDCGRDDVKGIIAEYQRRVDENLHGVERHKKLLSLFAQHPRAKVVGSLPSSDVEQVFS